ncbi:MAG: DNA polymerase III subunit delta' [Arachnia sp.]
MASVWADLVGQERAIAVLQRAVAGGRHATSHAWLFAGPPGSGRSNAARAFAAALQCPRGGCGKCGECRTTLSGAHPDVTLLRTEQLSIGVEEVRELVSRANVAPIKRRYQIVVVEDADRITERGADALLKAIEEPADRTIWLLCAPSADDVIVTIRSRCRELRLVTPSDEAVTRLLIERDAISPELAAHCAKAAQGHVGRARALARSDEARSRRSRILDYPLRLITLTDCLTAAENLVAASADEAEQVTAELDARELADLQTAMGASGRGAKQRHAQAAIRDLQDQHKLRRKRLQRDALDRVLTEFTTFYRDVLAVQTAPGVALVNADRADDVATAAKRCTPEDVVGGLDAILAARTNLEGNVAPQLAMESLLISLSQVTRRLA